MAEPIMPTTVTTEAATERDDTRDSGRNAAIGTVLAAVRARLGDSAVHNLHPEIIIDAPAGWFPATDLVDGARVPELIDAATRRWRAQPHAAAALAWNWYTYWLALPAVVGFAAVRRVPLLHPEDVLLSFCRQRSFLAVGLGRAAVAVLPSDPLAAVAGPGVEVVRDEPALLDRLAGSLRDAHLDPVLEQIRTRVHVGRRTLLGSLAAGVAYGMVGALAHSAPEPTVAAVRAVLAALGVADLVELSQRPPGRVRVRRRTCCLAFTLPEPKICAGCVLRP